jgi:hypothetical protein
MRRIVLMLFALTLAGCATQPCDVLVHEVYFSPSALFLRGLDEMEAMRKQGWRCREDGPINDAAGRAVGTRFNCERCK